MLGRQRDECAFVTMEVTLVVRLVGDGRNDGIDAAIVSPNGPMVHLRCGATSDAGM